MGLCDQFAREVHGHGKQLTLVASSINYGPYLLKSGLGSNTFTNFVLV